MNKPFYVIFGVWDRTTRSGFCSRALELAVNSLRAVLPERLAKQFADVTALLFGHRLNLASQILRKAYGEHTRTARWRTLCHVPSMT